MSGNVESPHWKRCAAAAGQGEQGARLVLTAAAGSSS